MIHNTSQQGEKKSAEKETVRIEAFSDGVFAIAITLLILELINFLHSQPTDGLLKVLLHHWESYLAFIIGFLSILICWINHHLVFTYINKADSKLMWVNGFVLLIVTLTPFPTAVFAEYFEKEPNLATAIFGVNYFLMSLVAYNLTTYTYNHHLIQEDCRELYKYFKSLYGWCSVYTFILLFVCFVSVPVAIALYCIMFSVFAFPKDFCLYLMKNKNGLNDKY